MENKIIELYDFTEKIDPKEYEKVNNLFNLDPILDLQNEKSNFILCGQTGSGKTTLLHTLLRKGSLLHKIDPKDIIIFSKTAQKLDKSYIPLIRLMNDFTNITTSIKIYSEIDMKIINAIINN